MRGHLALITGATAGIGQACAEQLAARGADLIITGRREARLRELSERLYSEYRVHVTPLAFDVSSREETEEIFAAQKDLLSRLTILINNAGLALGTDLLQNASLDDVEAMIDTNLKGLLYVTRLCLPHFIKRDDGHIVNLGSVAGRFTYPGGAVYSATKYAVRALSESLRMDLMGTKIRVTNIAPGMVESEFSEVRLRNAEKAKAVYQGMTPLQPSDIAEAIVWCLDRPKHVNIQEIIIYPTDQAGVGPSYLSRKK
jgi:3-hydroxy acid dehydrogenase / malonic semialdehyde reductase